MNFRSILHDIQNKIVSNGNLQQQQPQNDIVVKEEAKFSSFINKEVTVKENKCDELNLQLQVYSRLNDKKLSVDQALLTKSLNVIPHIQPNPNSHQLEANKLTICVHKKHSQSNNFIYVEDYRQDIYEYLRSLEIGYRMSPSLLGENRLVTGKIRAHLINWLVRTHHKFNLILEVLYKSVQIIDLYLEAKDVAVDKIEITGVTSLFLAIKYESREFTLHNIMRMMQCKFNKMQIQEFEVEILNAINFRLGKPLPIDFLRKYSISGDYGQKAHLLAKYFMESTLHCLEFSRQDPSYIAACAFSLSAKILLNKANLSDLIMEAHCDYKEETLRPGMQKIAQLVLESSDPQYKFRAAFEKYEEKKYLKISTIPELSYNLIKNISNGIFS